MDYAVIISAVVLGLSVLASLAKFLDWFLHSDPKTMVRTLRWLLLLLVLAAIPLLVWLTMREQWAGAMLLGAAMIAIPTFLKWNAVSAIMRAAYGKIRPRPAPFEMPPLWEGGDGDASSVRQAAAILEAYVASRGGSVPAALAIESAKARELEQAQRAAAAEDVRRVREALAVLGLGDGADIAAVHTAHRRLMRGADPDAGGSSYLAAQIDEARDVLIIALARRSGPAAIQDTLPRQLTSR